MTGEIRISRHAVARYVERVDGTITHAQARAIIAEIAATGRARPTPRQWMGAVKGGGGVRFVYSARHSDVCLVVRDRCVVTVHSRAIWALWRKRFQALEQVGRSRDRRRVA